MGTISRDPSTVVRDSELCKANDSLQIIGHTEVVFEVINPVNSTELSLAYAFVFTHIER